MQEGPGVICHPFPVLKGLRGFINTPNTQMNSDFCAFVIKSASLYSKDARKPAISLQPYRFQKLLKPAPGL